MKYLVNTFLSLEVSVELKYIRGRGRPPESVEFPLVIRGLKQLSWLQQCPPIVCSFNWDD